VLGALFRSPAAPVLLSWAGFLFDTTVVLWLSWRRSRPYAYALLLVFHALTAVLFPIGMFPVIMSAAALVYFAPDWPRRLLAWVASLFASLPWAARWLPGRGGAAPSLRAAVVPGAVPRVEIPSTRTRGLAALALGYCVLQAVLPLRFALYADNVRWHEQGMRFSWRVMVREKNGSVTFRVTSLPSGRVFEVSPRRYLTPLQEREMAGQPDLIAQLARHVREDFERKGLGPVEVRVDAWASLNGRRARRLIDPDVDLARVDAGLAPAVWILPAPDERAPTLSRGHG
jgi:vitamin K-dependent gamma-carboxylase